MKKFKTLFLGLIFFIVSSINAFGYNDASSFFTALYYPQAAYFMTDRIGVLVGTNNFRFMGTSRYIFGKLSALSCCRISR